MEKSNVERMIFFVAEFDAAVRAEHIIPKLGERPKGVMSAFEIATQMKSFGETISGNTELHASFLNHVRNCDAKIANAEGASTVREILRSIPGVALTHA